MGVLLPVAEWSPFGGAIVGIIAAAPFSLGVIVSVVGFADFGENELITVAIMAPVLSGVGIAWRKMLLDSETGEEGKP